VVPAGRVRLPARSAPGAGRVLEQLRLRATGVAPLGEDWNLSYQASYAFQTDGGTSGGENPVDYKAHYALADLSIGYRPIAAVGGGFELLGSDHGDGALRDAARDAAQVQWLGRRVPEQRRGQRSSGTPTSYVSPALPWKLTSQVIYHQFWSDEHSHDMGREIDAVLSRKLGAYVTVLAKAAWYENGGRFSPRDTTKYWLETTVAF
jgi:hypothetical protein